MDPRKSEQNPSCQKTYRVVIKPSALKQLESIPKRDQARIVFRVDGLRLQPRPQGVEKLAGETDGYRIRSGNYRVVYAIDDRQAIVVVIRVGDRKDVYR